MVEEDIPVPASTMVPFINSQQVGSASKYHSLELVSFNYISDGKTFLEPKLSRTELMIGRHLMKLQCERGT